MIVWLERSGILSVLEVRMDKKFATHSDFPDIIDVKIREINVNM